MNKISVILLIYNRPDYYTEALDSLKAENSDFELVIVANIQIDYDLSVFPDVKIIPSPDNLLEAYLSGMEVARYNAVAFLDDDDRFVQSKILYLEEQNIDGYYHNEYTDFGSKEAHNNGKGFNMSSIAINREKYSGLNDLVNEYPELGYMPDSVIYWYALEHHLPIFIDDAKLTYYRHKQFSDLYHNLGVGLQKQISCLNIARKVFSEPKVQEIVREGIVQNQIYLNSTGSYKKVPFRELIWLLHRPVIQKKSKILAYFLSFPLWHGFGIRIMQRWRVRR